MEKIKISKFLSEDGFVRASAITCPDLINELSGIQKTSPPSTLALSRALISSLLMASHLKDGQVISLQFKCSGPMKMLFAQASYEGTCRAYISEPQLNLALSGTGKLSLNQHVGEGHLTVSNYIPGRKLPQTSQVLIESGEITEDIAHYILTSQQLPCMLTTGLSFDKHGKVLAAGGLLVELMPGHTEIDISRVEQSFKVMGALSEMLESETKSAQILDLFFLGYKGKRWEHPHPVDLTCSCSQAKVLNSIKLLGVDDLKDILEKNESTSVDCQMCGRMYRVEPSQIKELLEEISGLH